ncbi:FGGY-family carbohydrate kinase [Mycoplasmatota bacterium WC44]
MSARYVLTVDLGTQGVRAIIFNNKGKLVEKVKHSFEEPYYSLKPGYAEASVGKYYRRVCHVIKEIKKSCPEIFNSVEAVSITTMRDVPVLVDDKGSVLRDSFLWLDQRRAKCEEKLPRKSTLIFKSVNMLDTALNTRKKVKANWIKENEPDIWEKTDKYLLLSGYLNYKLTGKMVDSIGSQIGHIPFDYKKQSWYSKKHFKWPLFNIEKEKLPVLVESGSVIGVVTEKASAETGLREGLPVIGSGSDKGCETLGSGCYSGNIGSLSFGTTATIQTTTNKYVEPIKFFPSYPSIIPNNYNPEIEIFRGYWMISWFKKEFSHKEIAEAKILGVTAEELLNQRLIEIEPGANGLILQPYWSPSLNDINAKGAIIGFSDVHTKFHIYRAIIEGINYALIEGKEQLEKSTGNKIDRLVVSGGGSQSDAICQITANMFGLPVHRGETYETSGLGAAICAFYGIGAFESIQEAAKEMVHHKTTFEPDLEITRRYDDLYRKVYSNIYKSLNKIYHEIKQIYK